MKRILLFLSVVIFAGCITIPSKRVTFNGIKIGMPRDEAVAILGTPRKRSAKGNIEHLYYHEKALYIGIFGIGTDPKQYRELEVRIVDGKVVSFGEVGEYFEEPLEEPEKK